MFALKVVWICLSITVVFCDETSISNLRPLIKPAVSACQVETNTDLDQFKTLTIAQPLSNDQSCLIDCVLRKFDLIQSDKFSVEKANSYVDKFMKQGEEMITEVKKTIVKDCVEETKEKIEKCELAGAMFQCMGRELQKAGFIKEHEDSPSNDLIYEIFESF